VYVFVPEQAGFVLTTGPVTLTGPPQLFVMVGGTGGVCALIIQGTVEPVFAGGVKVGGVIVIVACEVLVHPFASVTVTV